MPKPLDELLAEGLELPAGPKRDAWIAVTCGSDTRLLGELRALIASSEAVPRSFLSPLVDGGDGLSLDERQAGSDAAS